MSKAKTKLQQKKSSKSADKLKRSNSNLGRSHDQTSEENSYESNGEVEYFKYEWSKVISITHFNYQEVPSYETICCSEDYQIEQNDNVS